MRNFASMRVLIFEPDHTGHHLTYVRLLIESLLPLRVDVTLSLGQQAFGSVEFEQQVKQFEGRLKFDRLPVLVQGQPIKFMCANSANFLETVRRVAPDHVMVPYADGLTQGLGLRRVWFGGKLPRSMTSEALMMRGAFAYPRSRWRQRASALFSLWTTDLSPWDRLHLLDPIPYDMVQNRGGGLAARAHLIPDPVPPPRVTDRVQARQMLGLATAGRYLGCAGVLDERKGIDKLIRAAASAKLGDDDRLLLLGSLSPGIRQLLNTEYSGLVNSGRIVVLDRYATDLEFEAAITAMDLVCTTYPRHTGSVSIAIRAAAAGRAVLASDWGWLGLVVPRFGLGWTCDATSVESLIQAIPTALDRAASFTLSDAGRRFVEFHSIRNFQACWTHLLRQKMGSPPESQMRTWQWALQGV
jgi:glycosyltransferase involved in cell wall biosynthesis